MKTKWICLLGFLLFVAGTDVNAQGAGIETANRNCHEDGVPTTENSLHCEKEAIAAWGKEMRRYYGMLRDEFSGSDRQALRNAQQSWEQQYDMESSFLSGLFKEAYEEGISLPRLATATKQKELVKARVMQLHEYYILLRQDE